jgi:hypothetical protein
VIGGFNVDSSWFWKFEDQKQIQERMELLGKLNLELVERASSTSTVNLRVDDARHLVESYIRGWLIKEGHCKAESHPVVKVFRKDEFSHFPLPTGATLADFIPPIRAIE